MTPTHQAISISLCFLALTTAACSTADGLDTGGGGGGGGSPPDNSGDDDGSYWDEPHPGLDDGSGDGGDVEPEVPKCITHHLRAVAYPIYANADGVEIVSPGAGEPHSGVCVGTEDVSEDGHWAMVTVCGPRIATVEGIEAREAARAAMTEAAIASCEASLLASFEQRWPELEQEYEHWLGPDLGTDMFTLTRVACIPRDAEDPWADYAAGSCTGYDDETLPVLEPLWHEDFEAWTQCTEDPVGECNPSNFYEPLQPDDAPAPNGLCDTYRRHVASDITHVVEGHRIVATIDTNMVDALMSLRFAACEYDRYDGTRFTEVDDWSLFAAIGLRDGDRPTSVTALANGRADGPAYPLGSASGQELEALRGLLGDEGRAPEGVRVKFVRGNSTMTLDVRVVAAD